MVQIEGLSFTHSGADKAALRDVTLHVKRGEFVVLCGASGSGKTTLMSLIKTALAPHGTKTGRILFEGRDIDTLPAREAATAIGFVMQHPEEQVVCDTVLRELCFGAENCGMEAQRIRRRVAETADVFGLTTALQASTATLSSGRLQQVALAAVTVLSPRLLLLDEPTAALDPVAAKRFLDWIVMLNRDYGVTVIAASHRLDEVIGSADRLVMLDEGRVVYDGAPAAAIDALGEDGRRRLPVGLQAAAMLGIPERPLTVRDGKRAFAAVHVCPPTAEERLPGETVLSAKELWFRYDAASPDVLCGASLTVRRGDVLCLFGGNGSGKSTLLTCLAGVRRPYHGKVTTDKAVRAVYIPQDVKALFTAPTVREELAAVAAFHTSDRTAEQAAAMLGIESVLSRHPLDLSGGERRLAALGLALVSGASLILLDEPTCSLDAAARARLMQALSSLCKAGAAVVAATHDTAFAAEAASACALMFHGAVLDPMPPRAFFESNRFYAPPLARMIDGALTLADVTRGCDV